MLKKTVVALSVATLATSAVALPTAVSKAASPSIQVAAGCNPCAPKACNPCNPCAAAACNPCSPCAVKKVVSPCNPCAASPCNPCNPCAAKSPCNPCNPCAAN